MKCFFRSLLFIVSTIFLCCSEDTNLSNSNSVESFPNILLIIADDMGKDATYGFDEGSIKPQTPNINSIKSNGITFNNFWSYPTCSPTRASIITGKYGYRTGVKWAGDILPNNEISLQKYIKQNTGNRYKTALIGKWHLSGNTDFDANDFGIDYYSGILGGAVQNYFQWDLTNDGGTNSQSGYTSKIFSDLAIDWIDDQDQPWFLWLAYNAPHTPFHRPPLIMHSQGQLSNYTQGVDPMPYYLAAVEAMDFQIGRILSSLTQDELENTVIIFMGDNGTPNQVSQLPFRNNSVKGSLYQGGINVPIFISGIGVNRQGDDYNLLTSTDLFSTIAQISGVSTAEIHDSKSFKNLFSSDQGHRNYQYSEMSSPNHDRWAISDGQYKLIIESGGTDEFYDLLADPYENSNLMNEGLSTNQASRKADLEAELLSIRD